MDLVDKSRQARKLSLSIVHKTGSPHIGSALSVIDILAYLFSHHFNKHDNTVGSNKFVFSKGHAAIGLYSAMKVFDLISQDDLETFCSDGSHFFGHVSHFAHPMIELSTGSLGHGLPFAIGLAQAKKIKGQAGRVFVVLSDGEMDEGTTWESALLANKLKLDNLLCIVDRNHLQSLRNTEETLPLEPLVDKWRSFGWDSQIVDGHNFKSLSAIDVLSDRPRLIIADTSKGRGVSWMQNQILWHYKHPDEAELKLALEEIEGDSN